MDVHKKTISYCVKDASAQICQEGKIGGTQHELDYRIKTLPQPQTIAMEATIFTGWIYDHLLPHAEQVKVAPPLMLHAIAAAKKKNDRIGSLTASFFRFLFQKGELQADLAASVPTVADWRLSTVPKFLTSEEVERVLKACDRRTATGRRDYTILLLLARLGLRAGSGVCECLRIRLSPLYNEFVNSCML